MAKDVDYFTCNMRFNEPALEWDDTEYLSRTTGGNKALLTHIRTKAPVFVSSSGNLAFVDKK